MGSLGALGGLPQYLQESWGGKVSSYKPLFAATILFSIVLLFVYSSISEKHQPRKVERFPKDRRFCNQDVDLGMVDNFGAGMAPSSPTGFFSVSVSN